MVYEQQVCGLYDRNLVPVILHFIYFPLQKFGNINNNSYLCS